MASSSVARSKGLESTRTALESSSRPGGVVARSPVTKMKRARSSGERAHVWR